MMKPTSAAAITATLFALAACGNAPKEENANDFAARIGTPATSKAPQSPVSPTVQETPQGPAQGAFVAGTQTDPEATCGATKVGQYIGKLADEVTRNAVRNAATQASEVRFITFGSSEFINPDPSDPRLNLMLDEQNIIRDARCG